MLRITITKSRKETVLNLTVIRDDWVLTFVGLDIGCDLLSGARVFILVAFADTHVTAVCAAGGSEYDPVCKARDGRL